MNVDQIKSWIPHISLHYFQSINSTNTYLKEHAKQLPDHAVAITTMQTQGKGRLGRNWVSRKQESLCMSILLKRVTRSNILLLPALCAVSLIEVFEKQGICNIGIKWPNDIVLQSKKIAGILCESIYQNEGSIVSVCGIGINLYQTQAHFLKNNLDYAGSVYSLTGHKISIELLAADIVASIERYYKSLCKKGFTAFYDTYIQHSLTVGKEVQVISDGNILIGRALAINPQGELVCNIDGKIKTIRSGEASVRGLFGYV